ncbi:major facilitator superfamily domain-containing protein [Entophlyctis helioformis]|nr:major facilitator superfamily domain-containing protein [Entophlyctis helioformis]
MPSGAAARRAGPSAAPPAAVARPSPVSLAGLLLSLSSASLVMLTAGTAYLFSLYGPQLSTALHLTQSQTAFIATCGNSGIYLSGPFFGAKVDQYRSVPAVFFLLGGTSIFLGYAAVSSIYAGLLPQPHFLVLAFIFLCIGFGSAACYHCGLATNYRNWPVENRGLAVGITVGFFGLSAFVFTNIGIWLFQTQEDGVSGAKVLDVAAFLWFLGISCLGINAYAALTLRDMTGNGSGAGDHASANTGLAQDVEDLRPRLPPSLLDGGQLADGTRNAAIAADEATPLLLHNDAVSERDLLEGDLEDLERRSPASSRSSWASSSSLMQRIPPPSDTFLTPDTTDTFNNGDLLSVGNGNGYSGPDDEMDVPHEHLHGNPHHRHHHRHEGGRWKDDDAAMEADIAAEPEPQVNGLSVQDASRLALPFSSAQTTAGSSRLVSPHIRPVSPLPPVRNSPALSALSRVLRGDRGTPSSATNSPIPSSAIFNTPAIAAPAALAADFEIEDISCFLFMDAYLLAYSMFTVVGVGLMYINNVGAIILSLSPADQDASHPDVQNAQKLHVILLSLLGFASRIVVGILSDLMHRYLAVPRSAWASLSAVLMAGAAGVMAFAVNLDDVLVASLLVGMSYGAVWTITPVLIGEYFGYNKFGSNWGWMTVVPAFGGHSHFVARICRGTGCFQSTFALAFWVCLSCVAANVVLYIRRRNV